jgi:hypothetical protein
VILTVIDPFPKANQPLQGITAPQTWGEQGHAR